MPILTAAPLLLTQIELSVIIMFQSINYWRGKRGERLLSFERLLGKEVSVFALCGYYITVQADQEYWRNHSGTSDLCYYIVTHETMDGAP